MRTLVCTFAVCTVCQFYGQELPNDEKMKELQARMDWFAGNLGFDEDESTANSILDFAKRNGIPQDTVISITRKWTEEVAEEFERGLPEERESYRAKRYAQLTSIMVVAQDSTQLPFLEKMSRTSSNREVRNISAGSYIWIAGTNALPFIRKTIENNKVDRSRIFREFVQKLGSSPAVDDENLAFLCEAVEKESDAYTARLIDEGLCKILQGYSDSAQRLAVAERLVRQNEPDKSKVESRMTRDERLAEIAKGNARTYWKPIKENVEKIPADKRTDLGKWFKFTEPKTE